MCTLCESDENLQEALNEKNEKIHLCSDCRCCEECCEEVEDIDETNWVVVVRVIRPAGWIFQDSSTFKRYEEYALYCGYCRDMFCKKCISMDCKARCDECSAPCSEGCECSSTTTTQ